MSNPFVEHYPERQARPGSRSKVSYNSGLVVTPPDPAIINIINEGASALDAEFADNVWVEEFEDDSIVLESLDNMVLKLLVHPSHLVGRKSTGGIVSLTDEEVHASLVAHGLARTRVTAQFDMTNDSTLADITGLSVSVVAGRTYKFQAFLFVDANVTGGHKYAIAGTCTATVIVYQVNSLSNTTNLDIINSRQTTLGGSIGQAGATILFTEVIGTITVNQAGTLTVQFAQNVATPATTSSVLVGSTFEVEEIT